MADNVIYFFVYIFNSTLLHMATFDIDTENRKIWKYCLCSHYKHSTIGPFGYQFIKSFYKQKPGKLSTSPKNLIQIFEGRKELNLEKLIELLNDYTLNQKICFSTMTLSILMVVYL